MKFFLLLVLCGGIYPLQAQLKDCQGKGNNNLSKQVEQLQQLKQLVDRTVDSLQAQLPQLAVGLENSHKKMEQLKKESSTHPKGEGTLKVQVSNVSYELAAVTNQADSLRKTLDRRLTALDKSLTLQKDLEEKINTLIRENNR